MMSTSGVVVIGARILCGTLIAGTATESVLHMPGKTRSQVLGCSLTTLLACTRSTTAVLLGVVAPLTQARKLTSLSRRPPASQVAFSR